MLAVALGLAAPAAAASGAGGGEAPRLEATAWLLADARTGERLVAHRPSRRVPIASATKLMTARIALEKLRFSRELQAAPYEALPVESVLGLQAGERISVRDLVVALMLPSANDAAVTIAEGVSGSVGDFVDVMNREARRLGLRRTSYANPIGLDDPENFSTAADLAKLALVLREDPRFRRIVAMRQATVRSGSTTRTVTTRNGLLLSDPAVTGVKTGHTLGAGYVLVASAERKGVPLVSVVLGAPSEAARDSESERLLEYGFGLYERRRLVRSGEPVGTVAAEEAAVEELELVAGRGVRLAVRRDQEVAIELRVPAAVEAPVAAGERIGRAVVTLDGVRKEATPALAASAIEPAGLLENIWSPVGTILVVGGSMLIVGALVVAVVRRRGGAGPPARRSADERQKSYRKRQARRREGKRT